MGRSCPRSELALLCRMALLHVGVCLLFPMAIVGWQFTWCVLKTFVVMWVLFAFNCGFAFVILRKMSFNLSTDPLPAERHSHGKSGGL